MKTPLTLLVVCFPIAVLASADPPRTEPGVASDVHTNELVTADGVASTLTGTGQLRAARASSDGEKVRIDIRTARGSQSFTVDGLHDDGPSVTLESFEWVDVVGDPDPELRAVFSSYSDPCGCDDGPTFSDTYVVVCRALEHGAQCSKPILSASSETVNGSSFVGAVQITPDGLARVKVLKSKSKSRRELSRITQPRKLFR
jgi:hypothetical protein